MELSPRLKCIADEVPAGTRFADIGTDHAYLPVWLLKNERISSAIASDLRCGPLERARDTARRFELLERISFRLCDGLSDIRAEEVDTVAVAGMGGETIAAILEAALWTRDGKHLFLLQPMSSIPELRVWLQEHSFIIEREHIALEGKNHYIVMVVRNGAMSYFTAGERFAGRQYEGMKEPLRGAYLDDLMCRVNRARAGLSRSENAENSAKADDLAATAEDLKRMKKEWQSWQR